MLMMSGDASCISSLLPVTMVMIVMVMVLVMMLTLVTMMIVMVMMRIMRLIMVTMMLRGAEGDANPCRSATLHMRRRGIISIIH